MSELANLSSEIKFLVAVLLSFTAVFAYIGVGEWIANHEAKRKPKHPFRIF